MSTNGISVWMETKCNIIYQFINHFRINLPDAFIVFNMKISFNQLFTNSSIVTGAKEQRNVTAKIFIAKNLPPLFFFLVSSFISLMPVGILNSEQTEFTIATNQKSSIKMKIIKTKSNHRKQKNRKLSIVRKP